MTPYDWRKIVGKERKVELTAWHEKTSFTLLGCEGGYGNFKKLSPTPKKIFGVGDGLFFISASWIVL
jgi:hypothetical protein